MSPERTPRATPSNFTDLGLSLAYRPKESSPLEWFKHSLTDVPSHCLRPVYPMAARTSATRPDPGGAAGLGWRQWRTDSVGAPLSSHVRRRSGGAAQGTAPHAAIVPVSLICPSSTGQYTVTILDSELCQSFRCLQFR